METERKEKHRFSHSQLPLKAYTQSSCCEHSLVSKQHKERSSHAKSERFHFQNQKILESLTCTARSPVEGQTQMSVSPVILLLGYNLTC